MIKKIELQAEIENLRRRIDLLHERTTYSSKFTSKGFGISFEDILVGDKIKEIDESLKMLFEYLDVEIMETKATKKIVKKDE